MTSQSEMNSTDYIIAMGLAVGGIYYIASEHVLNLK